MRISKVLLLLLCALLLTACAVNAADSEGGGKTSEESEETGLTPDEGSGEESGNEDEMKDNTGTDGTVTAPESGSEFTMTAIVDKVGELIEVTVIEAPYGNTGPFWVLTSPSTEIIGKDGCEIPKGDIKPGDTVRISYGGQIMMSYPPRVSAFKIEVTDK